MPTLFPLRAIRYAARPGEDIGRSSSGNGLAAGQFHPQAVGPAAVQKKRPLALGSLMGRWAGRRQPQFSYLLESLTDIIHLQAEVMQAGAVGFQPAADGVIVGSDLKEGGQAGASLDPGRVAAFVRAARGS